MSILLKKFEKVGALDVVYSDYCRQFIQRRSDALRRMFYDERSDCYQTATACATDNDCSLACAFNQTGFYCDTTSRLCLPKTGNLRRFGGLDSKEPSSTGIKNKCFPHKGVFAVIKGDSQTGGASWKCVSLFPALIDDSGNRLPGVCEGADSKFTVNIKSHYPRIEDCACSADRTLVTFGGRAFGDIISPDDIPRCVLHPHLYV